MNWLKWILAYLFDEAGGLDGLTLAIGLHLTMEEVVPPKCWNAIDAANAE